MTEREGLPERHDDSLGHEFGELMVSQGLCRKTMPRTKRIVKESFIKGLFTTGGQG